MFPSCALYVVAATHAAAHSHSSAARPPGRPMPLPARHTRARRAGPGGRRGAVERRSAFRPYKSYDLRAFHHRMALELRLHCIAYDAASPAPSAGGWRRARTQESVTIINNLIFSHIRCVRIAAASRARERGKGMRPQASQAPPAIAGLLAAPSRRALVPSPARAPRRRQRSAARITRWRMRPRSARWAHGRRCPRRARRTALASRSRRASRPAAARRRTWAAGSSHSSSSRP